RETGRPLGRRPGGAARHRDRADSRRRRRAMSDDQHRARLAKAVVALQKLQAKLDAAERSKREPIAILGAGCRIPGGLNDPESFWRLLASGKDTAGPLPAERWDAGPLLNEADPYAPGSMFTRYGNYVDDVA